MRTVSFLCSICVTLLSVLSGVFFLGFLIKNPALRSWIYILRYISNIMLVARELFPICSVLPASQRFISCCTTWANLWRALVHAAYMELPFASYSSPSNLLSKWTASKAADRWKYRGSNYLSYRLIDGACMLYWKVALIHWTLIIITTGHWFFTRTHKSD